MNSKFIGLLICLVLITTSGITVFADTNDPTKSEYNDDVYLIETFIDKIDMGDTGRGTSTKTASKTTNIMNSAGTILWSVKVTGTFTYNGSSSSCTSSTVTTTAPSVYWTIKSKSASKSGSTATATATAVKKLDGVVTDTMTKTVKLTCSKTGVLS